MQLRVCFLLAILTYQQLMSATTSMMAKRPLYFITNDNRRLPLNYLTKRERMVLQQVIHLYQHQGIPLEEASNTTKRKKLLILLLLLLVSGSLCYIAYRLLKPSLFVQATGNLHRPPVANPLGQEVPQSVPQAHAATEPHAATQQAHSSTAPVSDDTIMTAFLHAASAMHTTNNNFKNDSVGSLVDSMHKMTQQSHAFASTVQGFMQPPSAHPFGTSYQQPVYEDPWLASMPQVPRHTPTVDVPTSTGSAKPKPPISVHIPARSNLEARFQNLKK